MTKNLTHYDFEAYVTQAFDLCLKERTVPIILEQVKYLRKGQREGDRDQFSILFKGPATPLLPQQIYKLKHEVMGDLPLFLVPIGRDKGRDQDPEAAVLYEAVFT